MNEPPVCHTRVVDHDGDDDHVSNDSSHSIPVTQASADILPLSSPHSKSL
jgi:hypothetical protein